MVAVQLSLTRPRTRWSGVLCEPFAGSAAVSLRALGHVPLVSYRGSKRGYARQILEHMGVDREPEELHLADRGPWYYVWAAVERHGWASMLPHLEALYAGETDEAIRPAWEQRRAAFRRDHTLEPDAPDLPDRAALWLWCLMRSFGGAGPWAGYRPVRQASGDMIAAPDRPARDLRQLLTRPPPARVVAYPDALAVPDMPGAAVYLDPPYPETSGYQRNASVLDDEALCRVAHHFARAFTVGLSLHREVDGLPARVVDLKYEGGRGRNRSKQQREVLQLVSLC